MKAIKMRHRPTIITAFAGLLMWLPASGWPAQIPALLSNCDRSRFEVQLAPALKANQKTDSQAIWLNRSSLAWPQSAESGKFKLYYSATGRLKVQNGQSVSGNDGFLTLDALHGELPKSALSRFAYVPAGLVLNVRPIDVDRLPQLHKQQLMLVREDLKGKVLDFTNTQIAGAMDDMYRSAGGIDDLGVTHASSGTQFKLWAPTAQKVDVCVYASARSKAYAKHSMQWNTETGVWSFNAGNRME